MALELGLYAFFVLLGVVMLAFAAPLSRASVWFQRRVLGYDLGERAVRQNKVASRLGGALLVISGIAFIVHAGFFTA